MRRIILILTIFTLGLQVKSQSNCEEFLKAEFNGDFKSYFAQRLVYPAYSQSNNIEGIAIIAFRINKKGILDSLHFEKYPDELIAENIKNILIKSRKNWKPTILNNEPIDFTYYIVINYGIKNSKTNPIKLVEKQKCKAEKDLENSKYLRGLEYIQRAIKLNPYCEEYYRIRAKIYNNINKSSEAKLDIEHSNRLERLVYCNTFVVQGHVTITRQRLMK